MLRERIAGNVYWFQSEIYAQVTAGAVVGPEWAVMVDTLALPEEALEIREFIETELKVPVRYVINTIYHADHTWGNCFFPGAIVIAHELCYRYMLEKNEKALKEVKAQSPIFEKTRIVLPSLTFTSGSITLKVGKKHLRIFSTPGSSLDCISVLVDEDRILFAGDAFMPIPHIVEGDLEQLEATIESIEKISLENIVQGHGDIILRGEIEQAIKDNLAYLAAIKKVIKIAIRRKDPYKKLQEATIESCGKSRVLLGGLVEELHRRNLIALLQRETSGKNG